MKSFNGKKIWLVGASVGIGASLAKELSNEGAIIALSSRSAEKLYELRNTLSGQSHLVFQLDVTDTEKVQKIATEINEVWGNIDCVIFMAASYQPHTNAGYGDIKTAKHIMDVNFNGAMNVVHATLPFLKLTAKSQLILCGSVAGYRGLPSGQPYCASKAAIINYAESLRIELPEIDIKVINPGFVKTRLTDKNNFKMPFIITPEEAAKAIVKGMKSSCFEIHFPKVFTYIIKFLRILPAWIYIPLMRMLRNNKVG